MNERKDIILNFRISQSDYDKLWDYSDKLKETTGFEMSMSQIIRYAISRLVDPKK